MSNATYYLTRSIAVAVVGVMVITVGMVMQTEDACLLCPIEVSSGSNEPGVGEDDPSESGFGPEFDSISAGGGAVDPVEMGDLEPFESDGDAGNRDTCTTGSCDDGGNLFDILPGLPSWDDLDLCALGICTVDPQMADTGDESGEGDVDDCQASVTCETGDDDTGGQGTSDDDEEDCGDEEEEDRCAQEQPETIGQPGDATDETPEDGIDCDADDCTQRRDSDGDTWYDDFEEAHPGDPDDPNCIPYDADCDGIGDTEEEGYGSDPTDPDDFPVELCPLMYPRCDIDPLPPIP